jgi:hypothetical protein
VRSRRRLVLEIAGIASAGAVVALVVIPLAMEGCEPARLLCDDEQISRQASPDGAREARVLVRNCGATTAFTTHVVVSEKRWLLPDPSHTVFVSRRKTGVRLDWPRACCLTVAYPGSHGVIRAETRAPGVIIDYQIY